MHSGPKKKQKTSPRATFFSHIVVCYWCRQFSLLVTTRTHASDRSQPIKKRIHSTESTCVSISRPASILARVQGEKGDSCLCVVSIFFSRRQIIIAGNDLVHKLFFSGLHSTAPRACCGASHAIYILGKWAKKEEKLCNNATLLISFDSFRHFFPMHLFSAHVEAVLEFIWIGKKRIHGAKNVRWQWYFLVLRKGNGALTSLDLNLLPWSPNYIIENYWLFPCFEEVSCKCHRKKCITVLTVCHRGKKIPHMGRYFLCW